MAKPRAVPAKKPKKTGMGSIGGDLAPAPTSAEWRKMQADLARRPTTAPRPKPVAPPKKVAAEPRGMRSRRKMEAAIHKRGLDAF